jgi:alkylation response protein AidB-like acyl-CoA dehydrogenase
LSYSQNIVKIHTIFEGTSEIQQLVIARAISGMRVE